MPPTMWLGFESPRMGKCKKPSLAPVLLGMINWFLAILKPSA